MKKLTIILTTLVALSLLPTNTAAQQQPYEVERGVFDLLVSDPEMMNTFLRKRVTSMVVNVWGGVEEIRYVQPVADNSFTGLAKQAAEAIQSLEIHTVAPYKFQLQIAFSGEKGYLFVGYSDVKANSDGNASLDLWFGPQAIPLTIKGERIDGGYLEDDRSNQQVFNEGAITLSPWLIGSDKILSLHLQGDREWIRVPLTQNLAIADQLATKIQFSRVIQHGVQSEITFAADLNNLTYIQEFKVLAGKTVRIEPATVQYGNTVVRAIGWESVDAENPGLDLFADFTDGIKIAVPGTYQFRYVWPDEVWEFLRYLRGQIPSSGGGGGGSISSIPAVPAP
ncbi:hypothetical protein HYW72_02430 [Candidatus Nomurabacteria bacterium]|nr:hypothetical protein [Candidatus Nomurabacteria bacterium]